MEDLLHGDNRWLAGPAAQVPAPVVLTAPVPGGITTEDEEEQLYALNSWMEERGLPTGQMAYDFSDPTTGEQKALFDLAWPLGIQEELSQPVVLLLNEGAEVLAIASQAGFRCFTSIADFRRYVTLEVLGEQPTVTSMARTEEVPIRLV